MPAYVRHRGRWAYSPPPVEPPFVVTKSRICGERWDTIKGTMITEAQLPSWEEAQRMHQHAEQLRKLRRPVGARPMFVLPDASVGAESA